VEKWAKYYVLEIYLKVINCECKKIKKRKKTEFGTGGPCL
jgi:hypothetical protein